MTFGTLVEKFCFGLDTKVMQFHCAGLKWGFGLCECNTFLSDDAEVMKAGRLKQSHTRGFKGSRAVWRFLSTFQGFQKTWHLWNPW